MLSRYLNSENDDKEMEVRVLEAMIRLENNKDMAILLDHCIRPSRDRAARNVVDMPADSVELPPYQGVARVLGELIGIFEGARDKIERRNRGTG